MAPDAVLSLRVPYNRGHSGNTLYFFKNGQYACWDVTQEALLPGFPRSIASDWPGLLERPPGATLRGALSVPTWGNKAYFFFASDPGVAVWDLERDALDVATTQSQALLPGTLTHDDFTPVYAKLADGRQVVYGFSGHHYTRWTVDDGIPAHEDAGFPRRIDADWKDGLVLAPRAGVYVDWPSRSAAHSNRKLYFFMGDLYLRWDVTTNTRNYRLDIASGWKGWPGFLSPG